MPVAVHCPTCGQELVAPNELIGQIAACPGCNAQFPISDEGNGERSTPAPPPPPPPTQGSPPAAPDALPDTGVGAPPAAQSHSVRTLPSTDAYFPPGKAPAPQPAAPHPEPTEQRARPEQQAAASTARAAQPAKFIAGNATDTAIELGQDGQLPMLVLAEGKSKALAEAEGQKTNPLILVAVLCFSLLASLSMLLLDTTAYYEEPNSKKEARTQIEAHYVKGNPLREPYQELLAAALQAQHKGDSRQEQKYYRQVSKMLREENKNAYTGVTGRVNAPMPPNDEHLDSLLRTLLR